MDFYKGGGDVPLILYRGEYDHPANNRPRSFPRAMYFGDLEVAHAYSYYQEGTGDYKASRIYPAYLVLNKPFISQPHDPFLEMKDVVKKLGRNEAIRIAKRFAKYIEETDQWGERINPTGEFTGVEHYLNSAKGCVENLYFQAYRFFDSQMEVNKLRRLGYDGAIHGGSGVGSAGKAEYCVFSLGQVYSTVSKSFME